MISRRPGRTLGVAMSLLFALALLAGASRAAPEVPSAGAGPSPRWTYVRDGELSPISIPGCGQPRALDAGTPEEKAYLLVESAAACIPGDVGRAIRDYLSLTGLRNYANVPIGRANSGLDRDLQRLSLGDPAFRRQALSFYARVSALDARTSNAERPTLAEQAGEGRYRGLDPGWAWRMALSETGSDPDRAMSVLAFCGHDDVLQARLVVPVAPEQAREAWERREKELAADAQAIARRLETPEACAASTDGSGESALPLELERDRETMRRLTVKDFEARSEAICPAASSVLYLPQSLDASADIPAELKARIEALDTGQTPAKYYHVYAAAYAACRMIEDGMPAPAAEWLQGRAAWAYRTLYASQDAAALLARRAALEAGYRAAGEAAPSPELTLADAYDLMRRWGYFEGGIPTNVPVSSLFAALASRMRPAGWSPERFETARRRVQALLLDWTWTEKQHQAGARFAAATCRPRR